MSFNWYEIHCCSRKISLALLAPFHDVFEYCDNGNLAKYLQEHPSVPSALLASIAQGVASGLAHIHAENIIHCDIAGTQLFCYSYQSP